jgi:hypothetical protein
MGMCLDGPVQALLAQPGQIGSGVLGARQDHPVGTVQLTRVAGPAQAHAGGTAQGLELVEVAQARVSDHHDAQGLGRAVGGGGVVEHAVFFGQAMATPHGQHAHGGHAGEGLQLLRARGEQAGVAPEAVEHKALDQGAFMRGQELMGAVEVGEGATAVDVGDQQAGGSGVQRGAHVDVVAAVQVDLGG